MQDTCKPILGVAVDSQDEYLDHIEELTHKLSIAEKNVAAVKVWPVCCIPVRDEYVDRNLIGKLCFTQKFQSWNNDTA